MSKTRGSRFGRWACGLLLGAALLAPISGTGTASAAAVPHSRAAHTVTTGHPSGRLHAAVGHQDTHASLTRGCRGVGCVGGGAGVAERTADRTVWRDLADGNRYSCQ